MDPNEVVTITDLASKGVVIDTPPASLPSNIFTDVRNVRFKDGAVRKIEGEVLLNDIDLSASNYGKVRYLAYWPNPNRSPLGGYYIFVIDYVSSGITIGQRVFIQDHTGTRRDITPTSLNSNNGFNYTASGWQHTLFAGGFAFVINNGIDRPHYILDDEGNTDINNIVLAQLPGWDSYNAFTEIFNETWYSATMSVTFDLAKKIDFTVEKITVKINGSLTTFTALATTNNINLSLDTTTNTHILTFNSGGTVLNNEDLVEIKFESVNVVQVRSAVIRSFKNYLIAGDLTEVDSTNNAKIVRRLSGVVRISDSAAPGSIPNNWNPFTEGTNTADEFTLSETYIVKDIVSMQGSLFVYTTQSIHQIQETGLAAIPFSFAPVTDSYGTISTNIPIEYEGKHFVVGSNDIYSFQGHPGNIQSIADGRIREYFFNNVNPIYEQQIFTLQNTGQNEIWLCYPTLQSKFGECDEALIWNYRNNTWTIRDLDSVTSGDVAPVKGGGVPSATLTLTGNSGNFGYTNRGKREVQRIIPNGHAAKRHRGVKEKQKILVGSFSNFNATGEITLTVHFPDGTSAYSLLNGTGFSTTLIRDEIKSLIDNNSSWTTANSSTNAILLTAAAVSPQNPFDVTVVSSGTLPTGFTDSTFTVTEERAGYNASTDEDVLVLTPPSGFGTPINVTLTAGTGNSNTFDIDSGVGYSTTPHITPNEIATLVYNAWQAGSNSANQAIWTLANPGGSSSNLDFTTVNRAAVTGTFTYTITQGTTRTGYAGGQTLISDANGSATTEGVTPTFARGTRVTLTLNGGAVIFDRHYGEGPGRILDSTFVPAANDRHYGSVTGWDSTTLANVRSTSNDNAYLALFYNPDATQNTAETNKSNGLAVDMTLHTATNNTTTTLIDLDGTNVLKDMLAVIDSNELINVTADSTSDPTNLVVTSSQFSSDASYVQTYNPFSAQVVAARVAPTTSALTSASEGSTVSDSAPTQGTGGTSISTTFDIDRPWSSSNLNPNKLFPIFAESGYTTGTLFNRIRAADISYKFGASYYVSYAERTQVSINPDFDTEHLESMALWGDGGTVVTVGGEPQPATLRVRARSTNNSGQLAYLTTAEDNTESNAKANKLVVNDFVVGSDHKVDLRVFGRFLNYRIDDANASGSYVTTSNKGWNISGLQLHVKKGGVK